MKDIPGHEGRYAINEDGTKILSYPKPRKMYQGGFGWTKQRYLTIVKRKGNYRAVTLSTYKNGKRYPDAQLIHRLVAITYISAPPFLYAEINHKDKNTANNHYSNLEWCTRKENAEHSWKYGRKAKKWKGTRILLPHKITLEQIKIIRKLITKGLSQRKIAKELQMSRSNIKYIYEKRGIYAKPIGEIKKLMDKKMKCKTKNCKKPAKKGGSYCPAHG